jgi:hypothetical protein
LVAVSANRPIVNLGAYGVSIAVSVAREIREAEWQSDVDVESLAQEPAQLSFDELVARQGVPAHLIRGRVEAEIVALVAAGAGEDAICEILGTGRQDIRRRLLRLARKVVMRRLASGFFPEQDQA